MSGLHSQHYLLYFASKLAHEEALFSGWHRHRACWEWGEPLSSRLISPYDSPKTHASTPRERKMKRALGSPCRGRCRETADPLENFSIQDYGKPGYTTEPYTSRQCWPQPSSRVPSGMLSSTQPCTVQLLCSQEPHTCSQEPQFDYLQSVLSPDITRHLLLLLSLPCLKYSRILFKTAWHCQAFMLISSNIPLKDKQLPPRCNGKSAGTTVSHSEKFYLLDHSG